MARAKLVVDRKILRKLYIERRLAPYKIAEQLGCSFSTISNRLREYAIPLRSPAEARMRYQKNPFSNNAIEKAYLLGFAIGDLNVYLPSAQSMTLVTRCHTTQKTQLEVFRKCFAKYGKVTASLNQKGSMHINAFLDARSFRFLLDKYQKNVPRYINEGNSWAFIAGYNDAEGNLLLNQGKARLKIDSYDYFVLDWIKGYLEKKSISCKFRQIAKMGQAQGKNMKYHQDLWRLNVNNALALQTLIHNILPYTLHKKRKADMIGCLTNIRKRTALGTI